VLIAIAVKSATLEYSTKIELEASCSWYGIDLREYQLLADQMTRHAVDLLE
jgi:hypothetical protein